jgi:hypothetical protein
MEFAGAGWRCFGASTIAGRGSPGEPNTKSRNGSSRRWKLGGHAIL